MRRFRWIAAATTAVSVLSIVMILFLGTGADAAQQPDSPVPAILQNYPPVTAARLLDPEPGNWLMIRGTYNGWGYSPLDEITPANVSELKPVWAFATGESRPHESAPVVNNGVMFVTTANSQVIAIDATTGNELWRYRRPRADDANVPHEVNRGVALWDDMVLYLAGEAVLVALDAESGNVVWESTVADNSAGYYTTLAPLVAGGKVLVGAS